MTNNTMTVEVYEAAHHAAPDWTLTQAGMGSCNWYAVEVVRVERRTRYGKPLARIFQRDGRTTEYHGDRVR